MVELRYFGGLSVEETAEAIAKAWMRTQLETGGSR